MKNRIPWLILAGVLAAIFIGGFFLMQRQVTITLNGQTTTIHTRALNVSGALRGLGYDLTINDEVTPSANTWLAYAPSINFVKARPLTIWIDPTGAHVEVESPAQTAREALMLIGVTPNDKDVIRVNGSSIGLDDPLPMRSMLLQYSPALPLQLTQGNGQQSLSSSSVTLGAALWQNGITVHGGDSLSSSFSQQLMGAASFTLKRGQALTISVDDKTIKTYSSAATVGLALAENGISLQNLDYSKPSEDSALPQDGQIQVIRVRLLVLDQQQIEPYTTNYTTDASLPSGTKNVTRAGQNGITDTRVIVRYENGTEVSRETEAAVVIQKAINEEMTIGPQTSTEGYSPPASTDTAGNVGTIDTEEGSLPYYYSASAFLTSYSPCRSGTTTCSSLTASGATVEKGVLGVTSAWYKIFKGYRIYIPGYGIGTVEDIGGGVSGKYWIDLGYSDSDWVQWSKTETIYFLSPSPSGFSGSLP